jgi:ATP-dependent helicase/nuclease subunit B
LKIVLPVDEPAESPSQNRYSFYRANGEVNEVREVVRRCLERKIPVDQVEVIVSDPKTYIPLLYELAERFKGGDQGPRNGITPLLRMTFADGLPARYSRPALALKLWLSWIESNYLQPLLVQMIRDGLLKLPRGEGISFTRLADTLQAIPIGHGKDRYLAQLNQEILHLQQQNRWSSEGGSEGENPEEQEQRLQVREKTLLVLQEMVTRLLEISSLDPSQPENILDHAIDFIQQFVRGASELDENARLEFLGQMTEVLNLLAEIRQPGEKVLFNVYQWLETLSEGVQLLGSRPSPGYLHVSHLATGGHAGRPYTFIVGLDENRFPGKGSQDPLLLDEERTRISSNLITSTDRITESLLGFERLLARLRGEVTLSYSCQDLVRDELQHPASIYKKLLADYPQDSVKEPELVSFVPANTSRVLSETEWWLTQLIPRSEGTLATEAVATCFPHLKRGLHAQWMRDTKDLTEYDGWIGEHRELDPFSPEGPVLSASKLEQIGTCPLAYFFKYILKILPPEEILADPGLWLDAREFGTLLHTIFYEFLSERIKKKDFPITKKHGERLEAIAKEQIEQIKKQVPYLNEAVFRKKEREIYDILQIFLTEEIAHAKDGTPVYLEASLGQSPEGEQTDLDSDEPIVIRLPNQHSIRTRGQIDRIDCEPEGGFRIYDYKTGSAKSYDINDPYHSGRRIQHGLYLTMLKKRLVELKHRETQVNRFVYYFPNLKACGDRVTWSTEDLQKTEQNLCRLCEIVHHGVFLATDNSEDCRYCDYAMICHPVVETCSHSNEILEANTNENLQSIRTLRGYMKNEGQ